MMMMIISPIQGRFGVIQGPFGIIHMMMITNPIGQLGLWAPSSAAGDVFTSTA
jgi:hypothetical protein